jgi:hypothetical protein
MKIQVVAQGRFFWLWELGALSIWIQQLTLMF